LSHSVIEFRTVVSGGWVQGASPGSMPVRDCRCRRLRLATEAGLIRANSAVCMRREISHTGVAGFDLGLRGSHRAKDDLVHGEDRSKCQAALGWFGMVQPVSHI